jgi:hypothetical protein
MRSLRHGWRLVATSILALALAAVAVQAAVADGQLNNISAQVTALQTQVNKVTTSGKTATPGTLSANADCTYGPSSQVFLPWSDGATYALAPQGDFSDTSGWQLDNATLATSHDPFAPGSLSLRIPGNGQATTPAMCVDLTNPTIRLFVDNHAGLNTDLKVNVLYENMQGNIVTLTLAKLKVTSAGWQPSITIPIGVNIASTASASGYAAVAFQFKPEGLAAGQFWAIDNVYVDPFLSSR